MQSEDNLTEEEFLKNYDASIFDRPSTAVDSVIFTVLGNKLHVLIVKRANHPYRNAWSLVGGFVDLENDHDLEATAKRKLKEKTDVDTPYLEQYGTIGNKTRDPRGWSVTTVYFALLPSKGVRLKAGQGALDIKWTEVCSGSIGECLAFDHTTILRDCTDRLKKKVLYTTLPVHLMPDSFTLNELQKVYETILETKLDHKSFRRRMLSSGILEETGQLKETGRRPASLYRRSSQDPTHFFLRNIEGSHIGQK